MKTKPSAHACPSPVSSFGIFLVSLLGCALLGSTSRAADIVWTNIAGGNWNIAVNWSPNQVPASSDTAYLTNNGTYTVTLNVSTNISGLSLGGTSGTQTLSHTSGTLTLNGPGVSSTNGVYTLAGGTLNGTSTLTLAGSFNWSSGTLGSAASPFVLSVNGGITLSGTTKTFSGGTLANSGTAVWTAGQINCNGTAVVSNASGAIFDLQGTGNSLVLNTGSGTLVNAGTLRKTTSAGVAVMDLICNNSGLIQVLTGLLTLSGGGTNTGQFLANSGTTLVFGGGTQLLLPGSSVAGAGNVSVSVGTVNVQGALVVGALTNAATMNFNSGTTIYATNLALTAGTLSGNDTVMVSGSTVWSGGIFGSASSSPVLLANGGLAISGVATKSFNGGLLVNGGAGTWTAGQINCNGTPIFSNAPSATFDLLADGTSFLLNAGSGTMLNAGTLRKTAGTGTSTFSLPCSNAGSVQVNSGTLALTLDDGTGTFTTTAGTSLNVNGTAILSPSASISGAGNFAVTGGFFTNNGTLNITGTNAFSGGTVILNGLCIITNAPLVISAGSVAFNGTGNIAPASLNFSGGTLLGSMTLTVSGSTAWSGGTFGSASSSPVLLANGGLTISGAVTKSFNGGLLVNGGAGTWTAGQINCNGTPVFSNAPSATFDLQADGTSLLLNAGSGTMLNAGTFRKTAGTGTSTFSLPCSNSGSVQVNTGTLTLPLDDSSGTFTPAAGTSLNVHGTATLSPSSSISGAGNFAVTGGALTNNGTLNITGTNAFSGGAVILNGLCIITNAPLVISAGSVAFNGTGNVSPASLILSGGTLLGSMTLTVFGPTTWTAGTFGSASSSPVLLANGGLTISGAGAKSLNGGLLVNGSTGTWASGQITCNGTPVFSNAPSATFDLQADGNSFLLSAGSGTMVNAGTLRKTVGTGTSTLSMGCRNSGTIQVNTGTLSLASSFGQNFYTQNAGQTILNGGNLTFPQTAQFRGGTLSGAGNITGSISNSATVSPGASPGILTISGNYTESPNAHLQIELGGTTPGTGHDQLSVGGTAKLAGTLDVSYFGGFIPASGNVFTSVVCNVRSGAFSAITAPTNTIGTVYTAKTVLIETGNASPAAQLSVYPAQIACRAFLVQASANDPDGTVTNVTLLYDTNVLVSTTGASAQSTLSFDFPGEVTFTVLATDNKGAGGATNVTVNIATLPLLALDPIGFQTNRAFKLCMGGETGTNYEVQASGNLGATNWSVLGVMQNTNGIWRFSDATATNAAQRFYRAHQLP